MGGSLPRNGSFSMWDWVQSPKGSPGSSKTTSRNASLHGGNRFGGGMPLRSNVSFTDLAGQGNLTDDPTRQVPRSREASGHGGNLFGSMFRRSPGPSSPKSTPGGGLESITPTGQDGLEGLGMRRSGSWMWQWNSRTPPGSTNSSAHGGNAFSPDAASSSMKRSNSFMWNWSKYRDDGPTTAPPSRDGSAHGGDEFAEEKEGEGSDQPAIEPPKGMMRNMSMGSFSTLAARRPLPVARSPLPCTLRRKPMGCERQVAPALAPLLHRSACLTPLLAP